MATFSQVILLSLACLLCSPLARGADWYVDQAATGSNDGISLPNAWPGLGSINWGSLAPGDTVWVSGGSYAEQLDVGASGTAGALLTIRNQPGEDVTLITVPMGMRIHDRSHVRILGLSCIGTGEYVQMQNSDHIEIAHGEFNQSTRKTAWPTGFDLFASTHHCWIHHNTIGSVGYSTTNDHGGVMVIGRWNNIDDESHYNLIENNVLFHGGHHIMEVNSAYNVIRNNYWHNEKWMSYEGNDFGNRHLITDGSKANTGWNLIEGNVFATCERPPDSLGVTGVSLRTHHNIVRRNVFYDNDVAGLNLSSPGYHVTGFSPPGNVDDNHVYHNVMFNNGYAESFTDTGFLGGMCFSQYGASDEIQQTCVKNNIMWSNNNAAIAFESSSRALQNITNNWEEAGDPLFVNDEAAIDLDHPELFDFRLQPGSPCIDAGTFLTATTTAGSGTALPVADAAYFTDGWGVIPGDLIQLEGETEPLSVVSVDYNTNTIVLAQTTTWTAGQGVSLLFEGAAPDQGTFEFTGGLATHSFRPSETDSAITNFDELQFAYRDPALIARGELLVFLPGTAATPVEYREFLKNAAALGYHSLGLMYDNAEGLNALSNTNDPTNPACHELLRLEVLDGTDRSPFVTVDPAHSIESRLHKALVFLHDAYPTGGWDQFLSGSSPAWNKLALAGHGQGAGHALLLAKNHSLARCLNFAGLDWWTFGGQVSPWLSAPFATPVEALYLLGHQRDENVSFAQLQSCASAVDVARYGPFLAPESEPAGDFRGRHFLATDLAPRRALPDGSYHGTMITDLDTPREGDGLTPVLKPAWDHMLTTQTPPVRLEVQGHSVWVYFSPGTLQKSSPTLNAWTPLPGTPSPLLVTPATDGDTMFFQLETP